MLINPEKLVAININRGILISKKLVTMNGDKTRCIKPKEKVRHLGAI